MTEFSLLAARAPQALTLEPYHRWSFADGGEWTAFYRVPTGYLLRFPDLADFHVSPDGRNVTCTPVPGLSRPTIDHLYMNQVLPLALSRSGRHAFHASAVEIAGDAVAFLAESGRGKSTMAANFAVHGYRFLTDDGLVIERDTERSDTSSAFIAHPSQPAIRLWDDSQTALLSDDADRAPAVDYTTKGRFLAGADFVHCDQPRPLRVAYFLGAGTAKEVTFARLREAEALIEWTKHAFLLDLDDRALMSAHFEHLAALANGVPAYRLDYPRRFEDLAALRETIVGHASKGDRT